MNSFSPFAGTRYNTELVALRKVVAPPYDVISSDYRDGLYELDAHNVVPLDYRRTHMYGYGASEYINN